MPLVKRQPLPLRLPLLAYMMSRRNFDLEPSLGQLPVPPITPLDATLDCELQTKQSSQIFLNLHETITDLERAVERVERARAMI